MHHYIKKGWDAEKFINLDSFSKAVYAASMEKELEEREQFFSIKEAVT